MKKLVIVALAAIVIAFYIHAIGWAQESTPTPAKQPTIEELHWQAMYLNEHLKAIQADFAATQAQLKEIQAKLKALQPPAIDTSKKPVEDKKAEPKKK